MLPILMVVASCESSDDIQEQQQQQEQPNPVVKLDKYRAAILENKDAFTALDANFARKAQTSRVAPGKKLAESDYIKNLLPYATDFAKELNISEEELKQYVSIESEDDYKCALVGLMMIATEYDQSLNMLRASKTSGSFKDCFMEATGLAAGAALVGGLAAGTMTRTAILRLLVRIGGKTALRVSSGAGLALIAAEIAWCMW